MLRFYIKVTHSPLFRIISRKYFRNLVSLSVSSLNEAVCPKTTRPQALCNLTSDNHGYNHGDSVLIRMIMLPTIVASIKRNFVLLYL